MVPERKRRASRNFSLQACVQWQQPVLIEYRLSATDDAGGDKHPRGTRQTRNQGRSWGIRHVDTGKQAKAAIICQSSIMRAAIAASLEDDGIAYMENRGKADVAVVVSGLLHDLPSPSHPQAKCILDQVKADKWVVLSGEKDDPVLHHLIDRGHDPCLVPEDIDGSDLCHVVRLAASGHVLSMGRFCRGSHPGDARLLSQANLDTDQWRLLEHLSQGLSNKEIAIAEETSESAIKSRLRCLLSKLGLSNRTKAAVLAARCGLGHE